MANVFAIHSVGASVIKYLTNSYPESLRTAHPCDFVLLSGGELNKLEEPGTTLSLFLYRVAINEHLRHGDRPGGYTNPMVQGMPPLALDLHYLMTVWAGSALDEHVILAWAMRQLHLHPILDLSSLSPEAAWARGDIVHFIPAELSNEDVMRIWDALEPPYRLSISYVARVVRIDPDVVEEGRPVVATRFSYTDLGTMP